MTASQTPTVFRSSTNLVQVPVVVRDGNGHAVGTLRAEDFQLSDRGKPQVISRFSVEKLDSTETLLTQRAAPGQPGSTPATPSTAANSIPTRFIALLIDDANLDPQFLISGRTAALRFLDTLTPTDRVAIYSVSGMTRLDFTGDRDNLREALLAINSLNRASMNDMERLGPDPCVPPEFPLTYYSSAHLVEKGTACADAEYLLQVGDRDATNYYEALNKLIAKLAPMPGDRSILLISPGMYVTPRFRKTANDALAGAIHAKVVISGLDARGVFGAHYSCRTVPCEYTTLLPPNENDIGEQQAREAFMEDLTAGTGGVFIHGNNDLDEACAGPLPFPNTCYLQLGFSPTDLKLDGQRHALQVVLKNPRGFTLQARDNYYAENYSDDPADQARRQIEEAFFSSQDLNGLPTHLQTQFFKDGDDATLTVTARIDATKLPFRKEGNRNRDDLTLVVGLFDQNGNFVSAYQKVIEMRLKDETLASWVQSGIDNSTDFNVKPGKYLVRLVVRDSEGDAMAEQSTGVKIPW